MNENEYQKEKNKFEKLCKKAKMQDEEIEQLFEYVTDPQIGEPDLKIQKLHIRFLIEYKKQIIELEKKDLIELLKYQKEIESKLNKK